MVSFDSPSILLRVTNRTTKFTNAAQVTTIYGVVYVRAEIHRSATTIAERPNCSRDDGKKRARVDDEGEGRRR